MKDTALVVMARYRQPFRGGIKQLAPVDPQREIIMDYSIHDALEAGFNKIVFIIRKDIEEEFRTVIGNRMEKIADVSYVFQDMQRPAGRLHLPGRPQKTLGNRSGCSRLPQDPEIFPSPSSTPMTTMEKKASKKSMSSSFPNSRKTAGLTTAWQASSSEIP